MYLKKIKYLIIWNEGSSIVLSSCFFTTTHYYLLLKGTLKRLIPFFPRSYTCTATRAHSHHITVARWQQYGWYDYIWPPGFSVDMYGHLLIDGHRLSPSFAFSSFILCKLKDPLQRLLLPCFLQWCIHHMHQFVSNCMWDVLGAKGYINP